MYAPVFLILDILILLFHCEQKKHNIRPYSLNDCQWLWTCYRWKCNQQVISHHLFCNRIGISKSEQFQHRWLVCHRVNPLPPKQWLSHIRSTNKTFNIHALNAHNPHAHKRTNIDANSSDENVYVYTYYIIRTDPPARHCPLLIMLAVVWSIVIRTYAQTHSHTHALGNVHVHISKCACMPRYGRIMSAT